MYFYAATCVGDFLCAYFSQVFKSRKKVLLAYILFCLFLVPVYLFLIKGSSLTVLYIVCGLLGFATGFWAVFVTTASEQFGTNLRATVTTTVPNMVRGSLALMTLILSFFRIQMGISFLVSLLMVGIIAFGLSLISLYGMEETYGKDLNYYDA